MSDPPGAPGPLTIDGAVACVIRVQGALDPWWSDRLGGLTIDVSTAFGATACELHGELFDQAALLGVLTTLYDLGLPLNSVDCASGRGGGRPSGEVTGWGRGALRSRPP